MSKNWQKDAKKDFFYKEAKSTGYRSRAAFKLKQICKKYKIIKEGNTIIDLGASPGGWSQVAQELTGENGKVIAVDMKKIDTIKGVIILRGDMTDENSINEILNLTSTADVVISDMSPNISGQYSMDHARSIHLAYIALNTARKLLTKRGNFLVKVFEGESFKEFVDDVKLSFRYVKIFSPSASRKSSSEIYVIGKVFLGK